MYKKAYKKPPPYKKAYKKPLPPLENKAKTHFGGIIELIIGVIKCCNIYDALCRLVKN
jgi:hypothetical protein